MFTPPYCPNPTCRQHSDPEPRFFRHHGSFLPKCRRHPVPRFRCGTCRRTFSRQTFRLDYRDHRPDLNRPLFLLLSSGVGLRQSSRVLGLSLTCTQLKFRKIARHLRRLNCNLRRPLPSGSTYQLDELETFEGQRNTRPLSVPILIERDSRYIVWAEAAPIRPRGRMTAARQRAIARSEARHGVRKDLSKGALERTFARGAALASNQTWVFLQTDEKSSYPGLAASAFGEERLIHQRTNSRVARTTWNPLFPINHTEAMARDGLGRLRRNSWLVSQKRRYLDLGLQLYAAFRNFVRPRYNGEKLSPAARLELVPRRLTAAEVLSWRQERGSESIHPLSRGRGTIGEWYGRSARAA